MTPTPASPQFALIWTATFAHTAHKFLKRHPELEGLFADVLRQIEIDPSAPRLRLHPLQGKYKGRFAVSLTYEHRIVLILRLTAKEVVLLDVGTHDEVYRG